MRYIKSFTAFTFILAPLCASTPMVKEAKDLGLTEIKNCQSCHTSKNVKDMSDKDMNEVGQWMMDQKAKRKAKKAEVAWLKEYYAEKKK